MKLKNMFTKLLATVVAVTLTLQPVLFQTAAYAAVVDYGNGIRFDAEYYAAAYPDAKALYGDDAAALLNHYLTVGILEGRTAYAGQDPQEIAGLKTVYTVLLNKNASGTATAAQTAAGTASGTAAPTGDAGVILPADDGQEAIQPAIQTQTSNGLVLVYLNGTDLESDGGSATDAVNQMISASASGNTRFVVLAGGTKSWQLPAMQSANNGKTVSFVVENGTIREMKQYGSKKDYLSPGMITEFIKDTKASYASDHTAMVFWDHGGGAAGGYGSDEMTDKGMSASAVAKGVKDSGEVFETIGFDTCLMGSLEVASNFSGSAKYFLGSQELESGYGWDYNSFSTYGTTDAVTFGKKLISDYDAHTKKNDNQAEKRTLAMYDLDSANIAQMQWNALVTKLGSNPEGVKQMAAARDIAREFDYASTADNRSGEIDLVGFLQALTFSQASAESAALLNTLKNTVLVKNDNTMNQVNGISVYLPGENIYLFDNKYKDIKGNNISDDTMTAYDKLASIYAGQREKVLFQQTYFDQKHGDYGPEHYRKKAWYDKEYGAIGTGTTCYYQDVKNGGFAIQSSTGLTPQMIDSAELRVMLKTSDFGYVSLGRTSTFCTTADKTSPVFNFNGQWVHINGNPVAVYQYADYRGSEDNKRYIAMYVTAKVNGKDSKIDIAWNATDKQWEYYGYVDMNTTLSTRSKPTPLKNGDTIQFLYDATYSGSDDLKTAPVFEAFTYDSNDFLVETKAIDQTKDEVLFHGTITDSYGKTISTPYFKVDPDSSKVTEEDIKGAEPEILPSNDRLARNKWVMDDGGEDSFLSCYYDPESGTYQTYDEDTAAFNMVFEASGDTIHYNEALGAGFYYSADEGKYYLMDEDGIVEDADGIDAETFAAWFGLDGDDDDFDAVVAAMLGFEDDDDDDYSSSDYGYYPSGSQSSGGSDSSYSSGSGDYSGGDSGDDGGDYSDDDDDDDDYDDDED